MSLTDLRISTADSDFYFVGGTLRPDALCYVEREADHTLYQALGRGEFCYVLTPRQMGKSSLMNALLKRSVAKVGNEPAVTKHQMRHELNDRMSIVDTPGMMWPGVDQRTAFKLAASHSIGRNAYGDEEVAIELARYLLADSARGLVWRWTRSARRPSPGSSTRCRPPTCGRRGSPTSRSSACRRCRTRPGCPAPSSPCSPTCCRPGRLRRPPEPVV